MKRAILVASFACLSSAVLAQVDRPANTVKMTDELLKGKTWTYQHPSRPSEFGDVVLRFDDPEKLFGKNAKTSSTGIYTVRDDLLCILFKEKNWSNVCLFVVQDQSTRKVIYPAFGFEKPLKIE